MPDDEILYGFDAEQSIFPGPLAGLDEAGRGPLAGPVVAAAVILPCQPRLSGLNDSKKLSPSRRQCLADALRQSRAMVGIGLATAAEIDRRNILQATLSAMSRAVDKLPLKPAVVLVDGNRPPRLDGIETRAFIGGDGRSASIAAASIAAKVYRDELMRRYDDVYPGYGFAAHKGYGTAEHMQAIEKLGPCPLHRLSFAPLRFDDAGSPSPGCGTDAEEAACHYLKKRGYELLKRNYKVKGGEIDIVAEQEGLLVFCEVKMRSPGPFSLLPRQALTGQQRLRIIKAARCWMLAERRERICRFDFLEVLPEGGRLKVAAHLQDVFQCRP